MLKAALQITANILEKTYDNGKKINDRYEIIRFLGRGSYGNSYLVFDNQKQDTVVLKLLRMHKRWLKAGRRSFEEEQRWLKDLNHPFFPDFFENGQYQNIPFFTMEYVNGKTFEQMIFDENMQYSEKESFTIAMQLLFIIQFLHKKGIVHRDIRIPNVMVDKNQLRLIDFGLARRFDPMRLPTIQLKDMKRAISPVSDFYALGHFLLFLLYSSYEYEEKQKEKSWDEELQLSNHARKIIRKLLAIEEPYVSCDEIYKDIETIISI